MGLLHPIQKPFLTNLKNLISLLQHHISVSPGTKHPSKEIRSLATQVHVTSSQISFLPDLQEAEKGPGCCGRCRNYVRKEAFNRITGFICRCYKGAVVGRWRVRGQVGRKIMANRCEWGHEERRAGGK